MIGTRQDKNYLSLHTDRLTSNSEERQRHLQDQQIDATPKWDASQIFPASPERPDIIPKRDASQTFPASPERPDIIPKRDTSQTFPASPERPDIIPEWGASQTFPAPPERPDIIPGWDASQTFPASPERPDIIPGWDVSQTFPASPERPDIIPEWDASQTFPASPERPDIIPKRPRNAHVPGQLYDLVANTLQVVRGWTGKMVAIADQVMQLPATPSADSNTDDGSGGTFLAGNAHGLPAWASTYVSTVSDLTTTLPDGIHHNVDAFIQVLNTLTPTGSTPLGEALFEAMRYYEGGKPAFGATIGVSSSGTYSSPIVYGCQKNYVILVTDGMANTDSASILGTAELNTNGCKHGACGSDLTNGSGGGPSVPWTNWPYVPGVDDPANTCGNEGMPGPYNHVLSSVAWYMYNTDLISDISGTQNVMTYTVGFDANFGSCTPAVNLLAEAADNNHGHGNSFLATSESALSQAFASVISEIFSVNSSFVAPVVPVSPENRTYSGNMIYMGFFLPGDNQFWGGNLKKNSGSTRIIISLIRSVILQRMKPLPTHNGIVAMMPWCHKETPTEVLEIRLSLIGASLRTVVTWKKEASVTHY